MRLRELIVGKTIDFHAMSQRLARVRAMEMSAAQLSYDAPSSSQ